MRFFHNLHADEIGNDRSRNWSVSRENRRPKITPTCTDPFVLGMAFSNTMGACIAPNCTRARASTSAACLSGKCYIVLDFRRY